MTSEDFLERERAHLAEGQSHKQRVWYNFAVSEETEAGGYQRKGGRRQTALQTVLTRRLERKLSGTSERAAADRPGCEEDTPETEYLCRHRKHFVVIKPQVCAKLDLIKSNRFQILMSKKHLAPKELAASNASHAGSQFLNLGKVSALVSAHTSSLNLQKPAKKAALAPKQKEAKNQPNEALLFLRTLNISPQTAFVPERFVDPSAQNHKTKKRDKVSTKLLQTEALASAEAKPPTPKGHAEDEALNKALKRVEQELS